MKTNRLINATSILLLVTLALIGCKKKCNEPLFKPSEVPALTTEGYNTCEAVNKNYTYIVCGDEHDYPYWSHSGDTILVCGYLPKNWSGDRSIVYLLDSPGTIPTNEYTLVVKTLNEAYSQWPVEVDKTKKCYIKGKLRCESLYTNSAPILIEPVVYVIEIHFE